MSSATDVWTQAPGPPPLTDPSALRPRVAGVALFSLVELSPQQVVKGVVLDDGFMAKDVIPVGLMRETCPYCEDVPLQLVLRARHVIRSHLFCDQCTRCFDAVYPDGKSALLYSRLPLLY